MATNACRLSTNGTRPIAATYVWRFSPTAPGSTTERASRANPWCGSSLVTPGEKIVVRVEDAPFVAIRVDRHGEGETQTLAFTTNVGDVVVAGPEHSIRVSYANGEPRPYVHVRGRLEARILRAPFYELVEWAEPRDGELGVWSGGAWWRLGVT